MYISRHTPSGQSQVYRVTQLRTDGFHRRESAGTGPVVLEVVPVTGAACASQWTNSCTPLFSHTRHWHKVGMLKVSEDIALETDVKNREFECGRKHCLSREPPGDLSVARGVPRRSLSLPEKGPESLRYILLVKRAKPLN